VRSRFGRTAVAALFTSAAIGLPCTAWFVTGSRATRDAAERLSQAPRLEARQEAERIARRLAVRLEALRHSESRRSYMDYWSGEAPFPDGADCEPRLLSPLAEGPADPLVWAHFQIDEVGELTVPSFDSGLGADEGRERARVALSDQQPVLEILECVASDRLASLPRAEDSTDDGEVQGIDRDWVITVGAFHWHSIRLEHLPALVALREVSTPTAVLTQGFVVRHESLRSFLVDARFPASLRPGEPEEDTESRVPLDGTPWTVAVDVSEAAVGAGDAAHEIRSAFRQRFAAGLFAAVLGGGLLVGMVWQADRLARQRARFAASAAHELRTPLAGLRLYSEMLADGSGDPSHGRRYAGRIAGEAERLGRVVSNLLGFSKLERGELEVHARPGDLPAAVRESLTQLRPAIEAGGARIESSIAETLPPVRLDRDAVHQILQNLLDNAAKYGRSASDRTIRVALERVAEGASLSVTDHGPGVDPSVRRRLFDAFVRHRAPDAPAGLGLGLALVRGLARAQGATVDYADAETGGARFTVLFPTAG